MLRACALTVVITVIAGAAEQDPLWLAVFKDCGRAAYEGHADLALSLAERAWQMIRDAGPRHPGYRDGVVEAAMAFTRIGRYLRVETIYDQAVAAAHDLPDLERGLRILQAEQLELHGKRLKAEAAWEGLVSADEARSHPTKAYSAELISLAWVKRSLGKRDEAERLYRKALGQPVIARQDWPASLTQGCTGPGDPKRLLDPVEALASFLEESGRIDEADQVLRSERAEEHLRYRVRLLAGAEKWEQAIAAQREFMSLSTESANGEANQAELDELLKKAGRRQEPVSQETQDRATGVAEADIAAADAEVSIGSRLRAAVERGDLDTAYRIILAATTDSDLVLENEALFISDQLRTAGRTLEMRSVLERVLLMVERSQGTNTPSFLFRLAQIIRQYTDAALTDAARRLLYRLEAAVAVNAGAQSADMEEVLQLRGELLDVEGKGEDARNLFRQWLDLSASLHGATSAELVEAHRSLAEHHAKLGRTEDARAEWMAAIEISRVLYAAYGKDHAELLSSAAAYFKAHADTALGASLDTEARRAAAPR
jgi:tetratricopeptide (TPR) repeat protein